MVTVLSMLLALGATANWKTATPEEMGMDSAALVRMFDAVAATRIPVHSIQIVRHGHLVLDAYFYPYNTETRHDVASVTKSVTSTVVGLAIARGHLHGVTQPLISFFPERTVAALDDRKRRLNLAHLLTMQAGWDCGFEPKEERLKQMTRSTDWIQFMLDLPMLTEPGARWAYCSGNCHILSAIISHTTGTNALAFARTELFQPLGITDVAWPVDANGHNHGWGDLQMHPRDMAKLGQLFLQNGQWEGRQVVYKEWIAAATRPHVGKTSNNDRYGYFWWVKGDDLPTMYEAVGRGGQRITIWPAKHLVVVFTGGGFEPADLGKFLLEAIKSDEPLPQNMRAARQLQQRLRDALKPPRVRARSKAPAMAQRISGKVFKISGSSASIDSLSLHFNRANHSAEAEIALNSPKALLRFPVGLDGAERFSTNAINGLPQCARGQWTSGDTFGLELDLVGGINFYTLNLKFADTGRSLRARIRERTGLVDEEFSGVAKDSQ
jgi:CubicO group peptidase (beta-lactamase class C family)